MSRRGALRLKRTAPDLAVSHWRHLVIVAAALVLTHAFVHGAAHELSVEAALRASPTTLVPVSAVFLAWPAIAIGLLCYGLYAIAPDQRPLGIHDQVSRHLVAAALLASLQLITLVHANPYLNAGIALALAGVAIDAYRRIHGTLTKLEAEAKYGREVARSAAAPFALLAGFTTMTALGFTDAAITAAGCPSTAPALALVVAAAALALRAGLHYRDSVAPAFASVALTTIVAAHPTASIASLTLLAGGLCGALAIFLAALQLSALRKLTPTSQKRVQIHYIVHHRPRV